MISPINLNFESPEHLHLYTYSPTGFIGILYMKIVSSFDQSFGPRLQRSFPCFLCRGDGGKVVEARRSNSEDATKRV